MKKFLRFLGRAAIAAIVIAVFSQLLEGDKPFGPASASPPAAKSLPDMVSPSAITPPSDLPGEEEPVGSGSGVLPGVDRPEAARLLDPVGRYQSCLCAVTSLNAAEKHIYCLLRDFYHQVASGERSDTIFKIDTAGLGITIAAAGGKFQGIDSRAIQLALWQDCAYEGYWTLSGWEYECEYRKVYDGRDAFDVLAITFKCEVLPEYAASSADGTQLCRYATDPAVIASVNRALENARAVAEAYSGLSDYDKLAAYRDYICGQVEYDYVAWGLPEEEQGGSPWQAVNVFDDDPATNVVCSGYSRAFKYLCDISDFSGDVSCYLVNGITTDRHMWNLIQINGQSYMADITACDSEWGRLGGLFLAGSADAGETGFTICCPRYDLPDGSYYKPETRTYTYSDETRQMYSSDLLTLAPAYFLP